MKKFLDFWAEKLHLPTWFFTVLLALVVIGMTGLAFNGHPVMLLLLLVLGIMLLGGFNFLGKMDTKRFSPFPYVVGTIVGLATGTLTVMFHPTFLTENSFWLVGLVFGLLTTAIILMAPTTSEE